MRDLILRLSHLREEHTEQSLGSLIAAHKGRITVVVPLSSIGITNWPVDIAEDYLHALFVGETIAEFSKSINSHYENKTIHYVLRPKDGEALTKSLWWLASAQDGEGEEAQQVYSEVAEFEADLDKRTLRFPEIADSYLANFVNGVPGFDEEQIEGMYRKHPEWRLGFWRSFTSQELKYEVYVSSFAWVIPHDLHEKKSAKVVREVLKKYAGFSKKLPTFHEAQWLSIGDLPPIVFSHYAMTSFPHRGIQTAQECAAEVWHRSFETRLLGDMSKKEREVHSKVQSIVHAHFFDHLLLNLSEDGEILIASDSVAQYLFFRESYGLADMMEQYSFYTEDHLIDTYVKGEGQKLWALPHRIQQQYMSAIDKISEALSSLEGNPVDVRLPWNKIDDDQFEQLCYDIIGESESFDPDTRRRMGKSRSRDGGRDIEVYSRKRIGTSPVKWIVQCKFTKRGRSVAGSNVNVSDVVDQYGAGGFVIMSNAPIDSTLHDKLEMIAINRKIEFDEWDGMRIERILAKPKYRNIKLRYFGV